MYKLLLSCRYLRTRWIAMASIVSVMLGVATLIVVNSVMAGFTQEMHKRLHGILSDLVFRSVGLDGFPDPDQHMQEIRRILGNDVAGMTPVVHVPALLRMNVRGQYHMSQINLIGVDEATYAKVSDFSGFLLHPENQRQLSFLLQESGYAPQRDGFPPSGWRYRRERADFEQSLIEHQRKLLELNRPAVNAAANSATAPPQLASESDQPQLQPSVAAPSAEPVFDRGREQFSGIVLGIAIATIRGRDSSGDVRDFYLCRPGDDVEVIFPSAGKSLKPAPVSSFFTVVDFYESKMSEYDASFAFVPLKKLQEMRGMFDPETNTSYVTSIQIKLRPGVDLAQARDKLRTAFPPDAFPYHIESWRDMQGPLLAAVQMETTILNILLFLIIAVAGFGILATFFMIVVEKTRDIGILKALGAPSRGVMSIFLGYGLSLGTVGAGVGMVIGLLFVAKINNIAKALEWVTGQEVFDPTVYYFDQIPTNTNPYTVAWVVGGSILIAVLASVLPALRAARLHPVHALRYMA